jgi:hypothetical protein
LTALEQATRSSRTLAQIDNGLESFSTKAADRYPAPLVYDKHLPDPLRRLDFGPVSAEP